MEQAQAPISLDDLLRHSAWAQALARHLVRDDAEDVVQDVWVQAAERPAGQVRSPRGWLAKLLLNRARSRARADQRRRRRELTTEPPTAAPSPHEVTERMEIHQLLAQLVAELPDQYRQVVYLRYIEDKNPIEIARLLATPPGTIRWRLNEALTRLRGRLDEREGGRRAWVAAFAPWATPGSPIASGAARPWRVRLAPVAIGLSGCLLFALVWQLVSAPGSGGPTAGPSSSGAGGPPGIGPGRPGVPRLTALAAGEDAQRCPDVQPMRTFVLDLHRQADPWRNLKDVFAESPPNPRLEAAFRPTLEGLFGAVPAGCEHSLSCRGPVCEMAVLIPDGMKPWDCHPNPGPEFRDRLSSGMNNIVDSGTPFYDPVKRKAFTRMSQLWRFHRDDAAAEAPSQRPALPELRLAFNEAPKAPPGLSEACTTQWRSLEGELGRLRQFLTETQPNSMFAGSAGNPGLRERFITWSKTALDRPAGPLPFSVDCRGQICALTDAGGQDPLAIKWQCREPAPNVRTVCGPAQGGNWHDLLQEKTRPWGRLRPPLRFPTENRTVPAYLVVRQEDSRATSWVATLAFMDSFDWKAAVRSCESQSPQRGKLSFRLDVEETTGDETPPDRVTLHVGGELGGTKLARCIADAFEAASDRFTMPPISEGAVLYGDFSFPFDPATFEAKLERIRGRLKTETKSLPF